MLFTVSVGASILLGFLAAVRYSFDLLSTCEAVVQFGLFPVTILVLNI